MGVIDCAIAQDNFPGAVCAATRNQSSVCHSEHVHLAPSLREASRDELWLGEDEVWVICEWNSMHCCGELLVVVRFGFWEHR